MQRIRNAIAADQEAIRAIYLRAFSEEESEQVAVLASDLLSQKENSGAFSLVAEINGTPVGHVAFSPVSIQENPAWEGFILAPLAVHPDVQSRGLGSALVESGIRHLKAKGVNLLFVYGDPGYYNRFRFSNQAASQYQPPYPLQYGFGWQAVKLNQSESEPSAAKIRCVPALRDPSLW